MPHAIASASPQAVLAWTERHRPDAAPALRARLPPLDGRWVALSHHLDLIRGLVEHGVTPDEVRHMGRSLGAEIEHHVPGAKLLLKLATPARALKMAPRVWRSYATFGRLETHPLGPRRARLTIHDLDPDEAYGLSLEGFFEGVLERCGATDPRVRRLPDEPCTFEGTWA